MDRKEDKMIYIVFSYKYNGETEINKSRIGSQAHPDEEHVFNGMLAFSNFWEWYKNVGDTVLTIEIHTPTGWKLVPFEMLVQSQHEIDDLIRTICDEHPSTRSTGKVTINGLCYVLEVNGEGMFEGAATRTMLRDITNMHNKYGITRWDIHTRRLHKRILGYDLSI